jgi:RNA 3'-terminal phosphate cyclase
MFIFGVKISPFQEGEEKIDAYWVDCTYLRSPEHRIYNINDYETFEIEVDFNDPQAAQQKIDEMVIAVENECPVAKAFGFPNTIGEGIVFVCEYEGNRYVFKAKGDKHSKSSKVKVLKPTDDVRTNKLQELAQKVCVGWRLEQMLTETFDLLNEGQLTRQKLGDYIKAVIADIVKEDSDIIVEAGFEIKDVSKYISEIARDYFFEKEKEFIGI